MDLRSMFWKYSKKSKNMIITKNWCRLLNLKRFYSIIKKSCEWEDLWVNHMLKLIAFLTIVSIELPKRFTMKFNRNWKMTKLSKTSEKLKILRKNRMKKKMKLPQHNSQRIKGLKFMRKRMLLILTRITKSNFASGVRVEFSLQWA